MPADGAVDVPIKGKFITKMIEFESCSQELESVYTDFKDGQILIIYRL